jgi:NAD+ kinase
MKPVRKLAFVVNREKPGALELGRTLIAAARRAGLRPKFTTRYPLPAGYLQGYDACCVIGGDGSLLSVAREASRAQVPIIGVNRGSLGFLTTFSADEARAQFSELLAGAYEVDHRSMLDCSTGPGLHDLALNDVLIKDANTSRLVRLEVFADRELVTEYYCDGLIFSTPTGSTAYNLSAGGPLIHPGAGVVAMTPICPHTLSNRSIIFRQGIRLKVCNRSPNTSLLVAMDGQRNLKVGVDSPILISISRHTLPLVQRPGYSHFAVMRTKLQWSGGASGVHKTRA